MKREKFIKEVAERGYEVCESNTIKNGIELHGISIRRPGDDLGIVLYDTDAISDVDEYLSKKFANMPDTPDVFKHVKDMYLCVQKKSSEEILKREFLDLELYIRVPVDMGTGDGFVASCKLKAEMLPMIKMTEDEVFDLAKKNTLKNIELVNIHTFSKLNFEEIKEVELPFAVSSKNNMYGAAVLACPEFLSMIGEEIAIIPTSIHELLLMRPEMVKSEDEMNDIIREANGNVVLDTEVLSDHMYYFINGQLKTTLKDIA